jgi:hypothetical protein
MMRGILVGGLLLSAIASASAQTTLRVGDQKGNSQAVMEAAGVLKDVPYKSSGRNFRPQHPCWKRSAREQSIPDLSATLHSHSPPPPMCR